MKFRSFFLTVSAATLVAICSAGCGVWPEESSGIDSGSQMFISPANADKLINYGRTQIGQDGGSCKEWARATVLSSYGKTIPSTDSTEYKWDSSSVVTKVAQWIGSYANGRTGPFSLATGATNTTSVLVPNNDSQIIVLYADAKNVTATFSKSGSTTLSVTTQSTSPGSGIVSPLTTSGAGSWTLMVKNNSTSTVSGIVAVVISKSRIQSDWETARRGDIIQMKVGLQVRSNPTPHTTFVQTDYNANGGSSTCGSSVTTGCNWLDSNSNFDGIVRARNRSLNDFITAVAYSTSYGFTIYRLN